MWVNKTNLALHVCVSLGKKWRRCSGFEILVQHEVLVKHRTHFYVFQKPPWHGPVCHSHTEIWSCNSYITYLFWEKTVLNTSPGVFSEVCQGITVLLQWLLQQESLPSLTAGLTIKSHSLEGQHFPVFQAFSVLTAAPVGCCPARLGHSGGLISVLTCELKHKSALSPVSVYLLRRKSTTWR